MNEGFFFFFFFFGVISLFFLFGNIWSLVILDNATLVGLILYSSLYFCFLLMEFKMCWFFFFLYFFLEKFVEG